MYFSSRPLHLLSQYFPRFYLLRPNAYQGGNAKQVSNTRTGFIHIYHHPPKLKVLMLSAKAYFAGIMGSGCNTKIIRNEIVRNIPMNRLPSERAPASFNPSRSHQPHFFRISIVPYIPFRGKFLNDRCAIHSMKEQLRFSDSLKGYKLPTKQKGYHPNKISLFSS